MKIFIGADHGGFELKNLVITKLSSWDYEFEDNGAFELDPLDDYPVFAKVVVQSILEHPQSLGILICRSGIGMSMVANRHKGIYAALCTSVEQAEKAREHNNANILCLDSKYVSPEINLEITKTFLTSNFSEEERHIRRLQMF